MTLRKIFVATLSVVLLSVPLHAAKSKVLKKEIPVTSKSKKAVQLFLEGRDHLNNVRFTDAQMKFEQALELDPNFATALAYLGSVQPGAVGEETGKRAMSLSSSLPETERMTIEALLADTQGDPARSRELREKLVKLAPNDWNAHFQLGQQLAGQRSWDEATRHLEHAVALNPKAGGAFNVLGYAYLAQGMNDKAVEAFRNYAAAAPQEPNAQDSLGEALMAAGRFEESERAFTEAARLEPTFYNAWEGIAMARFLRGDWDRGVEALVRAEDGARRPPEKAQLANERAWVQFARGDLSGAFVTLDQLERDSERDKLAGYAFVPLTRATFYNQMNRPSQALAQIEQARQRGPGIPGGNRIFLDSLATRAELEAQLLLGRVADARSAAVRLREIANQNPQFPQLSSNAHLAEGRIALAEGKARGALEHYKQCLPQDVGCSWERYIAENTLGDRAAADATRTRILGANYRDPTALHIVTKLR